MRNSRYLSVKDIMYFLAVNFHYIHDEGNYPHGGIYPVTREQFAAQLKELGRSFVFISQGDLVAAVRGEKELPKYSCLITFDDGLRCQYTDGLAVLDTLKIPAMFFVNALPYKERKVCLVHKIQYLRAQLGAESFMKEICDVHYEETGKPIALKDVDGEKAAVQYRYDEKQQAQLKFLLNKGLDYTLSEKIVGRIFSAHVPDEAEFCKDLYLDVKMLNELHSREYLGVHSYAHRPLSIFSPRELRSDLDESLRVLYGLIDAAKPLKGISYPYGSQEAVSRSVAQTIEQAKLGFVFGFTMERAFNRTMQHPLLLARTDTNDVPGGKHPFFFMNGTESPSIINEQMSLARRVYYQEHN